MFDSMFCISCIQRNEQAVVTFLSVLLDAHERQEASTVKKNFIGR